uniref:Uncharacterized protein n=1 Tax=Gopherus agassizii TaxID=38772 RepID=A0A452HX90_9SAUR
MAPCCCAPGCTVCSSTAPLPSPSPSCWGPLSSNTPLTRVRMHSVSASTTGNCGNTSSTNMRHKKSEVRAAGAMERCLYPLVQTLQFSLTLSPMYYIPHLHHHECPWERDNHSLLFCIHQPPTKI